MMPRMIPFAKGHGLGNDYIVMDAADLSAPLSEWQISRICDRNWGVGSDGILLLTEAWDGADFGLRILNPDGSEAEKSGNGLRILGLYLRTPGMHTRLRPTQQGTPIAKDVWLLGIGVGLLADEVTERRSVA